MGFKKNPLSYSFTKRFDHNIGDETHEVERNQKLISDITDNTASKPKLYPSNKDYADVQKLKQSDYVCMAPTSVWSTKELPKEQSTKSFATSIPTFSPPVPMLESPRSNSAFCAFGISVPSDCSSFDRQWSRASRLVIGLRKGPKARRTVRTP